MNWLKNIFGKKKAEEAEVEIISQPVGKERKCSSCGIRISPDQKYTKQMGLFFHRLCWKKEKKAAPL